MTPTKSRSKEPTYIEIGRRYGYLFAREEVSINGRRYIECVCEPCGSIRRVCHASLASGHTKSCGCLAAKRLREKEMTRELPCTLPPRERMDPRKAKRPEMRPPPGTMQESLIRAMRVSGARWAEIADACRCTVEQAKAVCESTP